jgi:hypothetical protein
MWQAIISNGVVVNVNYWETEVGIPCDETTQIGDLWDGEKFIVVDELDKWRETTGVTPLQFRLALNTMNLRRLVENAVIYADQDTKDMWEFASEYKRNNQVIINMAKSLNITDEQLDGLFQLASSLKV